MAEKIRITTEEMRIRSMEYTRESENFQKVITNIEALLMQLQSEWGGVASQAFEQKFNDLKPSFIATKELIDEIASNLITTANSLEELGAQI